MYSWESGALMDTFKLQVREGSYTYQVSNQEVNIHVFQEPLKEELGRMQKQKIIVPFNVDLMS